MRLLILRHAKADRPAGVADRDRPLAPRGRADAERLGKLLAREGLLPERVVVSAAKRARETLDCLAAGMGASPAATDEPRLYEATCATILEVIRQTVEASGAGRSLMVVGHNPGLHETAARLAGGGDRAGLKRLAEGFPTAALAVLDLSDGARVDDGTARLERLILRDD